MNFVTITSTVLDKLQSILKEKTLRTRNAIFYKNN